MKKALKMYPDTKSLVFAGGVSANQTLRFAAKKEFGRRAFDASILRHSADASSQNYEQSLESASSQDWHRRSSTNETDCCNSDDCESRTSQNTSSKALPLFFPPLSFSGDNAAMVALAAAHEIATGVEPSDPYKISILPRSAIN